MWTAKSRVKALLAHAEANGTNATKKISVTQTGTAVSRPTCLGCAKVLQDENVQPLSPLK
jgi:transposase-like protein